MKQAINEFYKYFKVEGRFTEGGIDSGYGALPLHSSSGQYYIEAQDNAAFTLKLFNNVDRERLLFVITVDGKNIITGEAGSVDGQGYVLNTHTGSVSIDGWRTSNSTIAQFKFTTVTSESDQSYAGLTGTPENVGVIGCAVFREKAKLQFTQISDAGYYPTGVRGHKKGGVHEGYAVMDSYDPRNTSANVPVAHKMGTMFGESVQSQSAETAFDREAQPFLKFQIYYDSRENLIKKGVIHTQAAPTAFPADNKFCKSPY